MLGVDRDKRVWRKKAWNISNFNSTSHVQNTWWQDIMLRYCFDAHVPTHWSETMVVRDHNERWKLTVSLNVTPAAPRHSMNRKISNRCLSKTTSACAWAEPAAQKRSDAMILVCVISMVSLYNHSFRPLLLNTRYILCVTKIMSKNLQGCDR